MTKTFSPLFIFFWKGFFFLALALSFSNALFAQKETKSYSLYKSIPMEARFLTTDKLQQSYLVNAQNDVIKLNPIGTEVFRYSNNKLGHLETIDVSNPFHILLYYPDFGAVIILDRTLNEINHYNLLDLGIPQTHALGISFDNNIWIYDELDFRLRKHDKQGEVLVESIDLSAMLPESIYPTSVKESNNLVYLHDPKTGILIFDVFGQYIKTIPFKNLRSLQVRDQHIFGLQDDQFYVWQVDSEIKHPINLPIKLEEGIQIRLEQNCFFALHKEELKIFKRAKK